MKEQAFSLNGDGVRVSESVTEGHPDKLADQVVDGILDGIIRDAYTLQSRLQAEGNPEWMKVRPHDSRIALEALVKGNVDGPYAGGMLFLAGEVTAPYGVYPRYEEEARRVIEHIGYTDRQAGFSHELPNFFMNITTQSPEIANGVGDAEGAGDQGIFFGYATIEDPSLMPLPIQISHTLSATMTELRKNGTLPWLKPDGKTQVGIQYVNGKPSEIAHITLATAHDNHHGLLDVRYDLYHHLILPVLDQYDMGIDAREEDILKGNGAVIINGAGAWDRAWGPYADTGVVGRKLDVDTYGGAIAHGGGALSGKDPTKVDRSAKYAARFVAQNIVREGLADRAQVSLAYTIGQKHPDSIRLDTFSTEHKKAGLIYERAAEILDLSVHGIIEGLGLFDKNITYNHTARNGHFGHEEFPWEQEAN